MKLANNNFQNFLILSIATFFCCKL